jgi:peptide/nickel transport system permease protein
VTAAPDERFVIEEVSSAAAARQGRADRSLWHRTSFLVGVGILGLLALLAIIGPFLTRDPLATDPQHTLLGPSWSYLFGTDTYGRDVFARAIAAARLDLTIGVVIAALSMTVGSLIGVVAGFWGGIVDSIVMRLTDILLAFPGFVLGLILVTALGNSIPHVVIGVSVAFVPYFIRLTRAQVLRERELEYVGAARLAGNGSLRTALRHVLPNSLSPSFVQATLVAGWAILDTAGLAFLGVGIRPPTAEWGVMVAEGANDVITGAWWTALFPGGLIVLAVLGFHFAGDELRGERK